MIFNTRALTLLFAITCTSLYGLGQTGFADTIKLEKRISVLNDKAFFDFPPGSVNSPRVADIMAADPNMNRETRIIYDNGSDRLVFLAQELYALSSKTMLEDVSKEVEPDFDFVRKIVSDNDSVLTVLSTPSLFDSTATAILVNSLLVKTQDNTVFRIDAYITPGTWPLKDEYVKLTENVFKTIVKGTRTINMNARDETYKIPGTTASLSFKLPKGYAVTIDEKYDFSVFKLNKYKDITDKSFTSIVLYAGHYPTFFYKEYEYTDSNAVKVKGLFDLKKIDWLYFKDDASHFYLQEQMMPYNEIDNGFILHAAMRSNKKETLDELVKIVEGIRVIK